MPVLRVLVVHLPREAISRRRRAKKVRKRGKNKRWRY